MVEGLDLTSLDPVESDGSHLTDDQVAQIERYMERVLAALDLGHWRVFVSSDLPPADSLLMISPTTGRRVAALYVSAGWWERDPVLKRVDLTHEALHLAHHDQESVIRSFFDDNGDVGPYVLQVVWSQFKVATERMVDSLSYVLAPHMPEWKEPVK